MQVEKMQSEKMLAGSTLSSCSLEDLNLPENVNKWTTCFSEFFQLRSGENYHKTGTKTPSPQSICDLVGVDCVKSASKIDDFGSKVTFPDSWIEGETNHPDVPNLFIVNMQIPQDFSSSFFTEVTDGPGWSLVLYFKLTDQSSSLLLDHTTAANLSHDVETLIPALRLFTRYCSEVKAGGGEDPMRSRFKAIMHCSNIDDFGLPNFITQYNGKPVLIKHTGTIVRGQHYIEMDINVHRFGSVPKKALKILIDRFDQMVIHMGFCIESRTNDEMPETLFGCATLNKPVYQRAVPWNQSS